MNKVASHLLCALIAACLIASSQAARELLQQNQPAPGRLFISITSSDSVTQQGQQPKIVAQFGNNGGSPVLNPSFNCYYYDDQPANAVVFIQEILYFQSLIPGQNQNAEHDYLAANLGTTHRYCTIQGTTLVNGQQQPISATSNTITVTVMPQQG